MNRLEFAARLIPHIRRGHPGCHQRTRRSCCALRGGQHVPHGRTRITRRRGDGIDRVARIFGSIIVALILGGFLFELLPDGLTRQTWSAFWVVVSLAVLWWKRREVTSFAWLHKKAGGQQHGSPVLLSWSSERRCWRPTERTRTCRARCKCGVQGKSAGSITVAISSGSASGPFRLEVDPEVTKTDAFDEFSLSPGSAVERSVRQRQHAVRIHLVDARSEKNCEPSSSNPHHFS